MRLRQGLDPALFREGEEEYTEAIQGALREREAADHLEAAKVHEPVLHEAEQADTGQ